ncbi:MAG: hypothetical protein WA354_24045 [Terracidiphilus sp.]
MPDLVVKVSHAVTGVAHPKLLETFRTLGVVAEVRVPETTKSVVACFVIAGVWVDEPSLLKCRVEMATQNTG